MDLSRGVKSKDGAHSSRLKVSKLQRDYDDLARKFSEMEKKHEQVLKDLEHYSELCKQSALKIQELEERASTLSQENARMADELLIHGSPPKNNQKRAKLHANSNAPTPVSDSPIVGLMHIPESPNPFAVLDMDVCLVDPLAPKKSLSLEIEINNKSSSSSIESPLITNSTQEKPGVSSCDPPNISYTLEGGSVVDDEGFQHVTKPYSRYPPVFISEVTEWPQLKKELDFILKEPYESRAAGNGFKISIQNDPDYRAIQDYLKKKNIPHVQIQMAEHDSFKVIIKQVHESITIELIKRELLSHGIITQRVSRLKKSRETTAPALVFIQLQSTDSNRKIYDISNILGTTVKVELFRKSNKVIQCYRCQGFNHGSLSCNLPVKCLKCAGNHRASECTLPKNQPGTIFKCSNCGGNHTSNFRNCPAFPSHHPAYYAKLKNQAEANKRANPPASVQTQSPQKSFFFSHPQENSRSHYQAKDPNSPKLYSVAVSGNHPSTGAKNTIIDKFGEFFELISKQMNAQMQAQMASQAQMLNSFRSLLHHG